MHPRYNHQKEYIVETVWPISDWSIDKMRNWLPILWEMTKPAILERLASGRFSITISEGKNRQIRRMVEKVWSKVKKLKRIRVENILLWNLQEWEYKALSRSEKQELFKILWLEN